MVSINVKTNIPKVQKEISLLSKRVKTAIDTSLFKSGFLVERHSKFRAPVDTGRLRSSIRPISSAIGPLQITIQPNVDYAEAVHEGTRFITARPFMTEGLKRATPDIQRVFNAEINRALR